MKRLPPIEICNVRFDVFRAKETEAPELRAGEDILRDGHVDFDGCRILLREGQPPTKERDSLTHETIHAFLEMSGIGHYIRAHLAPGTDWDDFEELLVRLATPHVVTLRKRGSK